MENGRGEIGKQKSEYKNLKFENIVRLDLSDGTVKTKKYPAFPKESFG